MHLEMNGEDETKAVCFYTGRIMSFARFLLFEIINFWWIIYDQSNLNLTNAFCLSQMACKEYNVLVVWHAIIKWLNSFRKIQRFCLNSTKLCWNRHIFHNYSQIVRHIFWKACWDNKKFVKRYAILVWNFCGKSWYIRIVSSKSKWTTWTL